MGPGSHSSNYLIRIISPTCEYLWVPGNGSAGTNRVKNRECSFGFIGKPATQFAGDIRIRTGSLSSFSYSIGNWGSADCPDRALANLSFLSDELGGSFGSRFNQQPNSHNVEWTSRFCQPKCVPVLEKRSGSQSAELVNSKFQDVAGYFSTFSMQPKQRQRDLIYV